MKKILNTLLSIILLAACTSCGKETGSTPPIDDNKPVGGGKTDLVVMSYNIRHCAPYYGTSETTTPNPANIVQILKRYNPDVVCLQEVDKETTRSNGQDQAKIIAKDEIGRAHV